MLKLAPAISGPRRDFLATPTGSYYRVGTPPPSAAADLVAMGIKRVIFTGQPNKDWPEVKAFLEESGIEISTSWNDS